MRTQALVVTGHGGSAMSSNVDSRQRYKVPRNPCPICGGGDNMPRGQGKRCSGFTSTDGEYAHCSREEHAGSLSPEAEGTYAHRLKGECKCGMTHNPAPAAVVIPMRAEIEATYDYTDEGGELLFQVVREVGKRFKQRQPVGDSWVWHLSTGPCKRMACPCHSHTLREVRRVPYHLVELLAAPPDKPICIAEGERDVDRLRSLGAVATCNPGGAGKLKTWKTVAEDLRGVCKDRVVYVIADADEPGRKHAREQAENLIGSAKRIFVKEPPAPHKDISDLLDAGGGFADLVPVEWSGSHTTEPPAPPGDPPPPPPGEPAEGGITADYTDLRNSEHLVEWHGSVLRFIGTWQKWLAWDGARWNMDDLGRSFECAKEVSRRLMSEAHDEYKKAHEEVKSAKESGDKERQSRAKDNVGLAESAMKHATKSQGSGRLAAMLDVSRSDPRVALHHDVLNVEPMTVNVLNGTINLRTGELKPHKQEDLITKIVPVEYDPSAKAPIWEAFLMRVMDGKEELVSFLQRAIGYGLTGCVHEHVLFFCYGNGANGKSTFLGTVHSLLGDYAVAAPRGLLFRARNERHPTELASLHGRRFVTCSEIEDGQAFDESLTKDLTGGDPITARRMREDFWTFPPTHKLWLAGNHRPVVRGDDEGIWRRMRLIPFTVTIPEPDRDTSLPEKLRAELPGILAWSVQGALQWAKGGLRAPDIVRDATAAYRAENDVLGQFFRERVVVKKGETVPRSELRSAYELWCQEIGAEPLGARRLASRLRERAAAEGVTLKETSMNVPLNGKNYPVSAWNGIRLLKDVERMAGEPS
jgi:putative DNA primase/helicase